MEFTKIAKCLTIDDKNDDRINKNIKLSSKRYGSDEK